MLTDTLRTLATDNDLNVNFGYVSPKNADITAVFDGDDAATLAEMLEQAGWTVIPPCDDDPMYVTGVSRV